jgi:small subunit ribosomal protein S9
MAKSIRYYYGTGRRKEARARVFLSPGQGRISVNGQLLTDYFGQEGLQRRLVKPLELVGVKNAVDCMITVRGSGPSGQVGAIIMGIARALVDYEQQNNENHQMHGALREAGYLTRDSREVERKKIGKRKARRGTQYSKR